MNEFINNNGIKFEVLDRQLYLETAHLSNLGEIMESTYFKEILDMGDDSIPFVVDKIINGGGTFAHPMLLKRITGIESFLKEGDDITTKNIKKGIGEWWIENKSKYGG
jgi:hypothetical protein